MKESEGFVNWCLQGNVQRVTNAHQLLIRRCWFLSPTEQLLYPVDIVSRLLLVLSSRLCST